MPTGSTAFKWERFGFLSGYEMTWGTFLDTIMLLEIFLYFSCGNTCIFFLYH